MYGESGRLREVEGEARSEGDRQDRETARLQRVFLLVLTVVILAEIGAVMLLLR